jgi:hypothetical protein
MDEAINSGKTRTVIYVIAILATFLLMAFLVRQMVQRTNPPPVGAERAAVRAKDNADIRASGAQQLNHYGFVDAARGVVYVPIEEAMKLTVQGYKTPGEFHSNLVTRIEKATAPPPKPPEAPNPYE